MAGPLSGIGQGQVPLANSFQPGQSDSTQIRPQNENQRDSQPNTVQQRGTRTADVQSSETGNQNDVLRAQREESLGSSSEGSPRRGSLVDITV